MRSPDVEILPYRASKALGLGGFRLGCERVLRGPFVSEVGNQKREGRWKHPKVVHLICQEQG